MWTEVVSLSKGMRMLGEKARVVAGETGLLMPTWIAWLRAFMALARVDAGEISPGLGLVAGRREVSISFGLECGCDCSYVSIVSIVARLSGVGNSNCGMTLLLG